MQRDGQAREGAVQRLSLACLHHLWSSPAGDSQVHPLGALLSADVADVPCSGVPATSPDTLRSLSTGVTQPHCFWWLDLPHPAGSHPNSWSPLQSWHGCPLHGHGIHAAMGHVPFRECSWPKQESLHLEVTGVTQDQLLQHREVPPRPAGWGGKGCRQWEGQHTLLCTQLCSVQTHPVQVAFATVPLPLRWECLLHSAHSACAHFGDSWVWAPRFPQQKVDLSRLLERNHLRGTRGLLLSLGTI